MTPQQPREDDEHSSDDENGTAFSDYVALSTADDAARRRPRDARPDAWTAPVLDDALQRFAETNRSLHEELAEEGVGALASSKQKLWLVEESLCYRIQQRVRAPPPPPAAAAGRGGEAGEDVSACGRPEASVHVSGS